jgi:hypothetical protein
LRLVDADHRSLGRRETGGRAALPIFREIIVVEPDPDGHRDPCCPVGRPHEQRIAKIARRPGLAHHRDRKGAGVETVGGAAGKTDHAPEPLLDRA